MAIDLFKDFDFVNEKAPSVAVDPKTKNRNDFTDKINDMLFYLEDDTYTVKRPVKQPDGSFKSQNVTPVLWWDDEEAKKGRPVLLKPKFGIKKIALDGKNTAIRVAKRDDIKTILETIKKATEAGELDKILAAAKTASARK